MENLYIYSYDNNSASVKLLAKALGAKLIRHEGSTLKKSSKNTILCWGKAPDDIGKFGVVFNHPANVWKAVNKGVALSYMDRYRVNVPEYTRDRKTALKWMKDGVTVVARTTTTGMDGEGTTVHKPNEDLPEAKLYTKLIPKSSEYRVHVVNGAAVDGMKKLRYNNKPAHVISTTANGYFFQKTGVVTPQEVNDAAVAACYALGLDYGGVDVLVGEDGLPYVLEVNSAFELGENTVRSVAQAILEMVAPTLPDKR